MLNFNVTLALVARTSLAALLLLTPGRAGAPIDDALLHGLSWRNIGPFRGGRISAASGVIGEPGTFYVGFPAGGVWKTTSAGETWFPVFDGIKSTAAIGALAVAPSDPNVVYAGTGDQALVFVGELNEGDGVYRSANAGVTWHHVGLTGSRRVSSIIVDPRDEDVLLAATMGPPFSKGGERGVYRSTNGGASWTRTLFVSDSTGVTKLAIAHDRPQIVFAMTTGFYTPPLLPNGVDTSTPPSPPAPSGGGIYKSDDGGVTWRQLTGASVPRITARTSIAVAQHSDAQRVYAITNQGFFRSDDGGTNWRQMDSTDKRIRNGQGGYNCGVFVDPMDPDVVYTFNTSAYKSTDGGETFAGFRGAPGGDDPQTGWIDPTNGRRILLGYDQGAIVTLDGGASWSSWYNQNSEQVYHISVDNSSPYWVYATQQDAGAVRTRARGDLGAITPLDWSPVNGWEWGTIIADPLNPNTVYSRGIDLDRIDMATGQWISVSPSIDPTLHLRSSQSAPIAFAPWNHHELLAGYQYLMTTTDGGAHWRRISPDLTYPAGVTPPPDTAKPVKNAPFPGTIENLAPSPVARGLIWVSTTNGLIKLTRDSGQSWSDVSIPNTPYPSRAMIEKVEASPFDAGSAYAVIDLIRAGDNTPHVYRTRDFGKHWEAIVNGLPSDEIAGSYAHIVRSDPKQRGLLFVGTESGMHVSFDDGDHWQSLQLNMPTVPCRDIAFAGSDMIVGTFGRGIWVLDDYAVLHQMSGAITREPAHLFAPEPALRVRRNTGYNTPFPLDVPHALNPVEGVPIDYWLATAPAGEVTIDVRDSTGGLVRHLSSIAAPPVKEAAQPNHPNFWVAPPFHLPTAAGANRTNWDLRYDPPPAFVHSFEINGNPGLTPASPVGALVAPGTYSLDLTVDGRHYASKVTVTNDPRSPATVAAVRAQVALQRRIESLMRTAYGAVNDAAVLRTRLDSLAIDDSTSSIGRAVSQFRKELDSVAGRTPETRYNSFFGARVAADLASLHGRAEEQFMAQETGDLAPTAAVRAAVATICHDLGATLARWRALNGRALSDLNAELTKAGRTAIPAAHTVTGAPPC